MSAHRPSAGQPASDAGAGDVALIPRRVLYGAHTRHALENFPSAPAGLTLGDHPELVTSLLQIKQAAARANATVGFLDSKRAALVDRACAALLTKTDCRRQFPVHILQGGGGTSANMNANEVVAAVANALDGIRSTAPWRIDALDHVNKNQSTNDVYPSACRLSLSVLLRRLIEAVDGTRHLWSELRQRYGEVPRLARTCLRDAVTSDFDVWFGACESAWSRAGARLERADAQIQALSLGGGVAGQPAATPEGYRDAVLSELQVIVGSPSLTRASDLGDAAQNPDELLDVANAIATFARILIKQCNDLRLLGSGPHAGIGELKLPAVQLGSSAVPGKVNPVIPEFAMQCAMQSVTAAGACGLATEHGELDLNVWEGVFVYNLAVAMKLLTAGVESLGTRCLAGMTIDENKNRSNAMSPTTRLAALAQAQSYGVASLQAERDDREMRGRRS